MDFLPNDPAMLVSTINMFLRDGEYDSLESICNSFDRDVEEVKSHLLANGYVWSEEQLQMRPIGYDQ